MAKTSSVKSVKSVKSQCCPKPFVIRETVLGQFGSSSEGRELREDGGLSLREDGGNGLLE